MRPMREAFAGAQALGNRWRKVEFFTPSSIVRTGPGIVHQTGLLVKSTVCPNGGVAGIGDQSVRLNPPGHRPHPRAAAPRNNHRAMSIIAPESPFRAPSMD